MNQLSQPLVAPGPTMSKSVQPGAQAGAVDQQVHLQVTDAGDDCLRWRPRPRPTAC
eukprot:CAMPEP_0175756090 /NCGR_PEP_ID=MMETSP0097-20121207/63744_1 /TAXON_ID=311494 /ORGANISM="Alexandrium monilatum, Strain CCMP3105" /LENGTH=55 /DNA_ID=CAMNT_0017065181 /DNA_START=5 /DNA_END=169 /DNA_ORIENTATION=+